MSEAKPYLDPREINSRAVEKSLRYAKRIFATDNLEELSRGDIIVGLQTYRTKKGEPLQCGTKRLIVNALRKVNAGGDLLSVDYGCDGYSARQRGSVNVLSQTDLDSISRSVLKFIWRLQCDETRHDVETCTAVAILLTMCTNLRMNELKQLKASHLNDLMNDKVINIKVKKKLYPG